MLSVLQLMFVTIAAVIFFRFNEPVADQEIRFIGNPRNQPFPDLFSQDERGGVDVSPLASRTYLCDLFFFFLEYSLIR